MVQSCLNDHTGTTSSLTKLLQLLPGEIKRWLDRASLLLSTTLPEEQTGRNIGLALLPIMDSLSHRFNGCEWSIPIRSRASVEDSDPWSGLFPALGSEGCYAEGWGNIQRGEKQIKLATKSSLFLFCPLLSAQGPR